MNEQKIYDEERIREENLMEPVYRHESDGSYRLGLGYDYLPKDELMCHEFWKRWREKMSRIRSEVLEGKYTPLYFYQEKNFMDTFSFANFLGVSFWRLKRHLKPRVFAKLKHEVIRIYADALDLSVEEFYKMNV